MELLIPAAVLCLPLIYWMITYNGFVLRRNRAKNAFAMIDVQLKKRWDLIPQLVATAKAYASHEKDLFSQITEARTQAIKAQEQANRFLNERVIHESAGRIIALAESYPELKADGQFELLQRNLTEIEAQISASRRSYNAAVTSYNTSLETVPSNLIARIHSLQPMELFSLPERQRENVTLS